MLYSGENSVNNYQGISLYFCNLQFQIMCLDLQNQISNTRKAKRKAIDLPVEDLRISDDATTTQNSSQIRNTRSRHRRNEVPAEPASDFHYELRSRTKHHNNTSPQETRLSEENQELSLRRSKPQPLNVSNLLMQTIEVIDLTTEYVCYYFSILIKTN